MAADERSSAPKPALRLVAWGTYDLGKPRVRILLRGLREAGVEVTECHREVWTGVEDKSQVAGFLAKLAFALSWLAAYPRLIGCYVRAPKHDVVFVGYLGQFDVLILWPFAKLRGVPIVWDAFLSLYNTVVEDRRLVGRRHPVALLLYAVEWLATRAADRIVLDTRAHADYFVERFGVPPHKMAAVLVGAEPEVFPPATPLQPKGPDAEITVLFYGQFIPLHGIDVIVEAARLLRDEPIRWVLIGQGQEQARIEGMLREQPLEKLTWVPWVPYQELIEWITKSDLCLGIFGATDKAARVVPNKVYQILYCGRPLVTRDSGAARELFSPDTPGVYLVPAGQPDGLAEAVRKYRADRPGLVARSLHSEQWERISPHAVGRDMLEVLYDAHCVPSP